MLSRPDGFMLYGLLGVDFFSTSELLHPIMEIRLRLIRARPIFYMTSDKPNVSLRIVDCSVYTRGIAFKDDYHKINPASQNQFIQENDFNNAQVHRVVIAKNTNTAFVGSYT